jgi:predicted CopG family antitoxin
MKRINVTFFEETYEKLEERMKKNGDKSIANSIRELVDLGLKIEEAARKNQGNHGAEEDSRELIAMLKKNLIWSLETMFLARHMVSGMPVNKAAGETNILEACKDRASNYVMGMLGEVVE